MARGAGIASLPMRQAGCWARPELLVGGPAGIEPATPSLPSMRGWFTTLLSTSWFLTTVQVRGTLEGRVVGRGEAACSFASGKSLTHRSGRPPPAVKAWSAVRQYSRKPRSPHTFNDYRGLIDRELHCATGRLLRRPCGVAVYRQEPLALL
jgi:hypothetical protein